MSEGLSAILGGLLPLAGAIFLGLVAYILSFVTCVGWIIAVPLLMYGAVRFLLKMIDGSPEIAALWSWSPDPVGSTLQMWGMLILFVLILLPASLPGVILSMVMDPVQAQIVAVGIGTLYGFLVVRFQFAPYLVVEGRSDVLGAFSRSFTVTGPLWGKMILLQLLNALLSSPVQVLGIGMQYLTQDLAKETDPNKIFESFSQLAGIYTALFVASVIAGVLGWSFFTAAYRQVFGRSTAAA